MGEMQVPEDALYGAQTQRAVDNFPVSGHQLPEDFIDALVLVKRACATANNGLGMMEDAHCQAIVSTCDEILGGEHRDQFPVDVYQTGSGTSSNMNANEVIATRATALSGDKVHPNDHVNMSQSSNDVIPTSIHVCAVRSSEQKLVPALEYLADVIDKKAEGLQDVVTTGRTHLMDAMPVTLGQVLSGWSAQVRSGIARIESALGDMRHLVIGGTAVGTGINAHPEFGARVCEALTASTGSQFEVSNNRFEAMSSQDAAVALSGQLKTVAVSIMKIANDLRWMNSGPLAGIGEIALPALQPGSSIMPGKVNPVIPESAAMVCARVIGSDTTLAVAGQSGNFQLNVMLPLVANELSQSIGLLANTARLLADRAIAGFTVNHEQLEKALSRNPILVTALNRVIGYELGAKIAKTAYAEQRAVIDVAADMTELSREQLAELLAPLKLTEGGTPE